MDKTIETVYNAGLNLLVPLTPDATFETIVQEAVKLVGAKYGSIILYEKGKLKRVYSSTPVAFKTQNRKNGNTYTAYKTGEIVITDIKDTITIHPELATFGIKSSIFIPLSYQGKSIGVLTVNTTKPKDELDHDIHALKLFGSMASLAIRKMQLYSAIKETLEMRDHFISIASHELRTPLTAINGYIQLMQSRLKKNGTVNTEWINHLAKESNRLTYLIKELLEVNHIKSGKMQYFLKEINIHEIMQRASSEFQVKYPQRKIIIENALHNDCCIIGDFDKLLQVFSSLLDNSVKFSPPESTIFITLSSTKKYIVIEIEDKGIGMEQKELKKIMNGFYKSASNFQSGMGVGLYLSQNIIEQHHGKIVIKSRVNSGTKVIISLPKVK